MLPLSLLSTATGQAMLIELKNGDTYNGKLVGADTWMNVNLEDVICTSRDGDRFWKLPQCYIRGNSIKYLRIPDEIIDMVAEEEESRKKHQPGKGGRGGRVNADGRGRGRPPTRAGRPTPRRRCLSIHNDRVGLPLPKQDQRVKRHRPGRRRGQSREEALPHL